MLQEVLLQERIWQAVEVISYFNENPEAWELLREESKPNYMEYVEKMIVTSLSVSFRRLLYHLIKQQSVIRSGLSITIN